MPIEKLRSHALHGMQENSMNKILYHTGSAIGRYRQLRYDYPVLQRVNATRGWAVLGPVAACPVLMQRCPLQKTSAASMYGTLNPRRESTVAIADSTGHLLSKKSKFSDSFNHNTHVYDTSAARWPKVRGCIIEMPSHLCDASAGGCMQGALLLCSPTL